MKKLILIAFLTLPFVSCYKKKISDPEPNQSVVWQQENQVSYTDSIIACSNDEWFVSKNNGDSIFIENGFLKLVSSKKYMSSNGIFPSVISGCQLFGDFTLKIQMPKIILSDTLNSGNFGVKLYSEQPFGATNTGVFVNRTSVKLGLEANRKNKILKFSPESAEITFQRTGNTLHTQTKINDEVFDVFEDFNSDPLIINFTLDTDSLALKSSSIEIDRISVTSSNGNLKSNDFNKADIFLIH